MISKTPAAKPSRTDGFVLSVDQGSNQAGVTLWRDGNLFDMCVLDGGGSDVFSRRLCHQVPQLTAFLDKNVSKSIKLHKVVFEGVKARLVMVTVGAFLTCPRIDAKLHQQFSFVESSSWKRWARDHGATGPFKEIKGVKSLKETGFPTDKYARMTEDIADSILIYKTWCDIDA